MRSTHHHLSLCLQEVQDKQHQVVTHMVVAKVAQLPDGSTALAVVSDSYTPGAQGPLFDNGGSWGALQSHTACTAAGAGDTRAAAAHAPTSSDTRAALECMMLDGDSPV